MPGTWIWVLLWVSVLWRRLTNIGSHLESILLGFSPRPRAVWCDQKKIQMNLQAIFQSHVKSCFEDEGADLFRKLSTVGRRFGEAICVLFSTAQAS